MTYSRYSGRRIFKNNDRNYRNVFFENRGIKETYQYSTPRFSYPSNEYMSTLTNVPRIWTAVDKLYNISDEFYDSPDYWWIIAWYNKKASESEFEVGEVYYVPLPLDDVLVFF